jgi:hypothetical protein
MTAASADQDRRKSNASRPRAWKRLPAYRRSDLSPEELATLAEKQKALRRTSALHVQLTKDEKATIKTRADAYRQTLSDFSRIVLLSDLKAPPPPLMDHETAQALIYQIQKLGPNLNQLAKHANETRRLPEAAAIAEVIDLIKATLGRIVT